MHDAAWETGGHDADKWCNLCENETRGFENCPQALSPKLFHKTYSTKLSLQDFVFKPLHKAVRDSLSEFRRESGVSACQVTHAVCADTSSTEDMPQPLPALCRPEGFSSNAHHPAILTRSPRWLVWHSVALAIAQCALIPSNKKVPSL